VEIEHAIDEWKEILRNNVVVNSNQIEDVGGFRPRRVPAFLYPESVDEIRAILQIANKHRAPIHPVSTGRNWGLGSKIPVQDNTSIMFLDKINKIIEVNEKFQYVIVEPGVTQGQLSTYLKMHHPLLVINVGGGGESISIVGNILERGTGVYGVKNLQDILAMEIMLPDGELIRTGLWNTTLNIDAEFLHTSSEGLGADIRGLFVQSNLGIVTKMVVKLRQFNHPLIANIMTDNLAELVETIRIFRSKNYIEPGTNIFDFHQEQGAYYKIENIPSLRWMAVANVFSSGLIREAAKACITNYLESKREFTVEFFDSQGQNNPKHNIDNWLKYSKGIVTNDNIKNLYKHTNLPFKDNFSLDEDFKSSGFLVVNTVVPLDGDKVKGALKVSEEVAALFGITYSDFGFSDLKEFSLKMHWVFIFDKTKPENVSKVHDCRKYLLHQLAKFGVFPQRLDVDSMSIMEDYNHFAYSNLLNKIKNAVDGKQIISPGRYISNYVNKY
jgi:4-cresol dehydrogenase (hydroxylating)